MLVVHIKHILAENDPALTDALGEFLRNLEASGIVQDFSFAVMTEADYTHEQLVADVAALVGYNLIDEYTDWKRTEKAGEDTSQHVFRVLQRLAQWLEREMPGEEGTDGRTDSVQQDS